MQPFESILSSCNEQYFDEINVSNQTGMAQIVAIRFEQAIRIFFVKHLLDLVTYKSSDDEASAEVLGAQF